MYGSMPAIFENLTACKLVAEGIAMEEKSDYYVVAKTITDRKEPITYYRCCDYRYLTQYAEKKYFPLSEDTYKFVGTHEILRCDETPQMYFTNEGYEVNEDDDETATKDGKQYYWEKLSSSDIVEVDLYELYELVKSEITYKYKERK